MQKITRANASRKKKLVYFLGELVRVPGRKFCTVCTNVIRAGTEALKRERHDQIDYAHVTCGRLVQR